MTAPAPRLPAPALEHVCDLHVVVGAPHPVGTVRTGTRRVVPITGGSASGPLLTGTVLGTGADWLTVLASGAAELDARYLIETDDGALIEVVDRGVRTGSPDVLRRLAGGEDVSPDEYYMRGLIRLETADERYAWVNATVFVGRSMRGADGVHISVFAVR
jgi:hypothetical protein